MKSNRNLFEGYNIYTEFVTGSLLDSSKYDEEKSEENYQDQLEEALEKTFPGADIEICSVCARKASDRIMKTSVYTPAGELDELSVKTVEELTSQVYDSLEWAVKKPKTNVIR